MSLVFDYVNLWMPDALNPYEAQSAAGSIRWAIASLVVVFPAYVWSIRALERGYAVSPATRELKTRKWLVYFTLFLAAVVIAGDVVALVYSLLNGDLTARFTAKAVAVFLIAGTIFKQYSPRQDAGALGTKVLGGVAVAVVAVSVIFGFFVVGSPQAERVRRFDERRANDLQSIQWEVINYWQKKNRLPVALADLRDDIRGFVPPQDPETAMDYEYAASGEQSFSLCAVFSMANDSVQGSTKPVPAVRGIEGDLWMHGAGRTCFERTIDPDLYPPVPIKPVPVIY